MSAISEKFHKEFLKEKKSGKSTGNYWSWLVKNKNCKKWWYISALAMDGRGDDLEFFKTRKEMMKVFSEMKSSCYDMRCYRAVMLMIDDESCEEIIDDEIIESYYDQERDEDA